MSEQLAQPSSPFSQPFMEDFLGRTEPTPEEIQASVIAFGHLVEAVQAMADPACVKHPRDDGGPYTQFGIRTEQDGEYICTLANYDTVDRNAGRLPELLLQHMEASGKLGIDYLYIRTADGVMRELFDDHLDRSNEPTPHERLLAEILNMPLPEPLGFPREQTDGYVRPAEIMGLEAFMVGN